MSLTFKVFMLKKKKRELMTGLGQRLLLNLVFIVVVYKKSKVLQNGARQCHSCLPSDSFHEILERLSDPVVRRLIVIEPHTQRVGGVISLRDVFSFFLG